MSLGFGLIFKFLLFNLAFSFLSTLVTLISRLPLIRSSSNKEWSESLAEHYNLLKFEPGRTHPSGPAHTRILPGLMLFSLLVRPQSFETNCRYVSARQHNCSLCCRVSFLPNGSFASAVIWELPLIRSSSNKELYEFEEWIRELTEGKEFTKKILFSYILVSIYVFTTRTMVLTQIFLYSSMHLVILFNFK